MRECPTKKRDNGGKGRSLTFVLRPCSTRFQGSLSPVLLKTTSGCSTKKKGGEARSVQVTTRGSTSNGAAYRVAEVVDTESEGTYYTESDGDWRRGNEGGHEVRHVIAGKVRGRESNAQKRGEREGSRRRRRRAIVGDERVEFRVGLEVGVSERGERGRARKEANETRAFRSGGNSLCFFRPTPLTSKTHGRSWLYRELCKMRSDRRARDVTARRKKTSELQDCFAAANALSPSRMRQRHTGTSGRNNDR